MKRRKKLAKMQRTVWSPEAVKVSRNRERQFHEERMARKMEEKRQRDIEKRRRIGDARLDAWAKELEFIKTRAAREAKELKDEEWANNFGGWYSPDPPAAIQPTYVPSSLDVIAALLDREDG